MSSLFKILHLKEISLRDFLNLNVDPIFVQTIQYPETKAIPTCQAPWCHSFGEMKSLKEVKSLNPRRGTIFMCTECCNKYYYNKESNSWNELEDLIHFGYFKVLPLIKQRLSTIAIANNLGRSRNYISKIKSYLASQNLIKLENICNSTIKKTELISIFNNLYQMKGTKVELARVKYGMSLKEYYYFYYLSEVQQFIYLRENENLSYIKITHNINRSNRKS